MSTRKLYVLAPLVVFTGVLACLIVIPFSEHLIDDYRLAYDTYRTSTQFKFTDASWAVSKAAGGTD